MPVPPNAPSWDNIFGHGGSGDYFAYIPDNIYSFVRAVYERDQALTWFNPSGTSINYLENTYSNYMPVSGNYCLRVGAAGPVGAGYNWATLQSKVYSLAADYASSSGSIDDLMYKVYSVNFTNPTSFTGPIVPPESGRWRSEIAYDFHKERITPISNGSGFIYTNPPPWPPPSGFSRIYPREISKISASGQVGWISRFTVILNGGLDGNTPESEKKYAKQLMKYFTSPTGWLPWDESRDGITPNNPDILRSFGLIQDGDYMGPWIPNELKIAIDRLRRVCVMTSNPFETHGGPSTGAFGHPMYSHLEWKTKGSVNFSYLIDPPLSIADTFEDPFSLDSWTRHGRIGPFSGHIADIKHGVTEEPGNATKDGYLAASGTLPSRNPRMTMYMFVEAMRDPLDSQNVPIYGGIWNALGTSYIQNQFNKLDTISVLSFDAAEYSSKVGDYTSVPSIAYDPSHLNQGWWTTDQACILEYDIGGGFEFQGPLTELTYPPLSGYWP